MAHTHRNMHVVGEFNSLLEVSYCFHHFVLFLCDLLINESMCDCQPELLSDWSIMPKTPNN